ncbi:MAG: SCO family protein [Myxococcales bacterium]|nr:SCO family protein [Myxococcales bacterium]
MTMLLGTLLGAASAWGRDMPPAPSAGGGNALPKQLVGVGIKERLGKRIDLDAAFIDHRGKRVTLRQYVAGGKPMILSLNYYRCENLCSLQLNAITDTLKQLEWVAGDKYRMVTVSFDPRDSYEVAAAKRKNYLETLNKALAKRGVKREADWAFLVGKRQPASDGGKRLENVAKLAASVGYEYKYLASEDQFAHTAAIYVIAPDGKISRYLYGLVYQPQHVRFALMDASRGKIGSTVDRIILSCFHYDPNSGSYTAFAFGFMRIGGVLTIIILAILIIVLKLRERKRHAPEARALIGKQHARTRS